MASPTVSQLPPPSSSPALPASDFGYCSRFYGESLRASQCSVAAERLPISDSMTTYKVSQQRPIPLEESFIAGTSWEPYTLPWVSVEGNCMITVEMAGPTPPKTTQLKPNTIRSMAGYVLHWCVDVDGGKGGFITAQWTRMLDVVVDPTRIYTDPYPPDTAFLTVTISSLTSPISPGDDDTYFPFQIAQGFKRLVDADENTDSLLPPENWLFFLKRTQEMSLGEWNQPWWKI